VADGVAVGLVVVVVVEALVVVDAGGA